MFTKLMQEINYRETGLGLREIVGQEERDMSTSDHHKTNYHLNRLNSVMPGSSLDNSNLVGHIQSIIVRCQSDISLLSPIRPNQGVNFLGLNIVHLLHCVLDLLLVSPQVNNEYQSVVVFNLLHCGLSC
ncbi:hypothetical protein V8G54_027322 [Vigna mungo]|uniref:Uncharacterized protein n=1 Tax=Vigna mungo TaxID=3915 RepID=A0AAQ3N169_VIGMU